MPKNKEHSKVAEDQAKIESLIAEGKLEDQSKLQAKLEARVVDLEGKLGSSFASLKSHVDVLEAKLEANSRFLGPFMEALAAGESSACAAAEGLKGVAEAAD